MKKKASQISVLAKFGTQEKRAFLIEFPWCMGDIEISKDGTISPLDLLEFLVKDIKQSPLSAMDGKRFNHIKVSKLTELGLKV